ncbi:MAG: hypothetical protein ACOC93_01165 [Planctomycetota bacterium]
MQRLRWIIYLGAMAALVGCNGRTTAPDVAAVPEPLDLLLPSEIRLHPFTGTRTFSADNRRKGLEVRVEARDAFGDPAKAFGNFRFELYTHRAASTAPTGRQLGVWHVPLLAPEQNIVHWDNMTRTYEFRLEWEHAIPAGEKFVVRAVFDSPFTERLFAERVFVAGE